MHLPTHRVSLSPSTKDKGLSEMLQRVARLGRLCSPGLPSPTLGISASTINPALILDESNTLNPATFSFRQSRRFSTRKNYWISLETAPKRLVSLEARAAAGRSPQAHHRVHQPRVVPAEFRGP